MGHVEILLIPERNEGGDGRSWRWTAPNHRQFYVRDVGGRYFLVEMKPVGSFVRNGKIIPVGPDAALLDERRKVLSPSAFYASLPDGIKPGDLCLMGGGLGSGAITYATLKEVSNAIRETLDADEWYQHHSPALALARRDAAAVRAEAESSLAFWRSQLAQLTQKADGVPSLFGNMSSMLGPLDSSSRQALLAFINSPSATTWEAIAGQYLLTGRSAWQIWCEHDPSAPRSRPLDATWEVWPTPSSLLEFVEKERLSLIRQARERVRALEASLGLAKPSISSVEACHP